MKPIEGTTPDPEIQPSQVFAAGQRRYRIRRLRSSSEKYGSCEVCKAFVPEVHHQVEEMFYRHSHGRYPYREGWTHAHCTSLFGHEKCLQERRHGREVSTMTDDNLEYVVHAAPNPDTGYYD